MANVVAKATGYKIGQKIIPKLPTFSGGEDEDYPVEQWLAITEMQLEDFMQTKDRKEGQSRSIPLAWNCTGGMVS